MFSSHPQVLPSNPPQQGVVEHQPQMSMVPMIGPSGELVYCMTQANQMMLNLPMQPNQQPLQLKLLSGEIPGVGTQAYMQGQQSEQILMGQMHSNRLISQQLGQQNGLMQPIELMQNQPLYANHVQQHFQQQILEDKQQIETNKMFTFSRSEPPALQLQSTSSSENMFSKTTAQSFINQSALDNSQASRTIISRTTSIEKEKFALNGEDSTGKLGPVEKAVFQEAIHILNKKRNQTVPQSCDVCNITLLTQVQSDNHYKSKKHSRAMLEHRVGQEKSAALQSHHGHVISHSTPAQNNVLSIERSQIANSILVNNKEIGGLEIGPNYMTSAVAPARFNPYAKSRPSSQTDNLGLAKDVITAPSRSLETSKIDNATEAGSINISSCDQLVTTGNQPSVTNSNDLVSTVNLSAVHTVQVPQEAGFTSLIQSRPSGNEADVDNYDQNKTITAANNELATLADELSLPDQCLTEQHSPLSNNDLDETMSNGSGDSSTKTDGSDSSKNLDTPPREVYLPDPLPGYITKMDRPPGRVLKESLHCTTCDIYVNSENQMKQHVNSLRHKNTLQGIPTPPKPVKEEKPKVKAEQYRCNVCKVTLNSDIQLSQHLSSLRHKNMLEGKPPKPRWSPYDRTQPSILRSPATLGLPFKSLQIPSLFQASQTSSPTTISGALTDLQALTHPGLTGHYLAPAPAASSQIKQASFMMSDAGLLQAREVVYLGGPSVHTLQQGASFPAGIPTFPGLVPGQQQLLQPVLTAPTNGLDWSTGLRLAS